MIVAGQRQPILIATKPVDFRCGQRLPSTPGTTPTHKTRRIRKQSGGLFSRRMVS